MKRFEYKTIEISFESPSKLGKGLKGLFVADKEDSNITEKIDNQLNTLGEQGWELVTVDQKMIDGSSYTVFGIFKREV